MLKQSHFLSLGTIVKNDFPRKLIVQAHASEVACCSGNNSTLLDAQSSRMSIHFSSCGPRGRGPNKCVENVVAVSEFEVSQRVFGYWLYSVDTHHSVGCIPEYFVLIRVNKISGKSYDGCGLPHNDCRC